MTPPPNLESCGGEEGRRLDKEADTPGEQELEFLRKIIKEKASAGFMQMSCKSVMEQQNRAKKPKLQVLCVVSQPLAQECSRCTNHLTLIPRKSLWNLVTAFLASRGRG